MQDLTDDDHEQKNRDIFNKKVMDDIPLDLYQNDQILHTEDKEDTATVANHNVFFVQRQIDYDSTYYNTTYFNDSEKNSKLTNYFLPEEEKQDENVTKDKVAVFNKKENQIHQNLF